MLVVGGPYDNSSRGAVWVFARSGTAWNQQGSKLVGSGATGSASQGQAVAINAAGTVLAVGGPSDDTNFGATWVWSFNGTAWTQVGNKLVGTGSTGNTNNQGTSVALNANGTVLAVGAPSETSGIGAI